MIALCAVASSGTTATSQNGGRTAHCVLKLQLNRAREDSPICNLSKNFSRQAECFDNAVVDYIISNWDRFKVFTHDHQGNNYPSREAYKTATLNLMTYGSAFELQAASEVFSCHFQIFRNGHLFVVFGEHFQTVKNIRFSGNNLSAGHFDAYVFSFDNEECESFESNLKVPGKLKQIDPKMPPKRKRSVRYRTHKVRENMRRKRENEAPLKQESRVESNRLRRTRLRVLDTVQDQETRRKSNCLQMMQGRISENVEDREDRLECQKNVTHFPKMAIWKD
ncbi:hypothetical protein TNCV_265811 [Trichonephila clavipes]|nr:hypothetical protein TNCV_265811 [Trichonephila clavipes]